MVNKTDANFGRQRKAHKKSRGGCSFCKLRRIKCDEGKPSCQKCLDYGGASCDYSTEASSDDVHMAGEASFRLELGPKSTAPKAMIAPPTPPSECFLSLRGRPLALHESEEVYRLTDADVATLEKFANRTVYTIGTAESVHVYREHIPHLSATHDFLTYVVLGLTLMHDRYLEQDERRLPSQSESFFVYQGTAIFKAKLSGQMRDSDRDAMWAGAALIGCITHASINETDAEECWPLRPPSQADMDWIHMGEGKKAVWEMTNPLRQDSIWRDALNYSMDRVLPLAHKVPDMSKLAPYITKLSDLDESSASGIQDPYHTAASILLRLAEVECTHSTIIYFLSFMGHMDSRFRALLQAKDPPALLLLAWWLAKIRDYNPWWFSRRSKLECRAICLYLERNHSDKEDILHLLQYPRAQCGLLDVGG